MDTTSVSGAVALGTSSSVTVRNAVALGAFSVANRGTNLAGYVPPGVNGTTITATTKGTLGSVSVGTSTATRQIINVAPGTVDSDAVNVAQLKAVSQQAAAGAVHYYSVNSTDQAAGSNYANDGATGTNAIAIGVEIGRAHV